MKKMSWCIMVVACGAALSACTVQPLYSDRGGSPGQSHNLSKQHLASIIVSEPSDRVEQQVRNELIFLLRGGATAPAEPAYLLKLDVTSSDIATEVSTQSTKSLRAFFDLQDVKTGSIIASGQRAVVAAYDIGSQEFAIIRARRNAEDRASRELANFILADVAARLAMLTTTP